MIYLIIKGARFIIGNENSLLVHYAGFDKKEVKNRAEKTPSKLEKAMIYQLNGDFRLFFMASGFLEESDNRKEEAAELYSDASDIRKRRDSSFSTHGMLFDKLAVRFERYYEVVRTAILESKLKPSQELAIDLSRDERINILLEKLNKEKDINKRVQIRKELSILVNMN
ncbi:hypothetical protein J4217_01500 [Candidatus Pacearchaeota archaeon]|nr:hypothetical protein [Candidatus Pacearchaeota archaeon]